MRSALARHPPAIRGNPSALESPFPVPLLADDWQPRTDADIDALVPAELIADALLIHPWFLDDEVRAALDAATAADRADDVPAYFGHLREALRLVYVLDVEAAAERLARIEDRRWQFDDDAVLSPGPHVYARRLVFPDDAFVAALPDTSTTRHRGASPDAWHIGDLDESACADVLASLGVSVGRGSRAPFMVDGDLVTVDEVGRLFAGHLSRVAARVGCERDFYLMDEWRALDDEHDRVVGLARADEAAGLLGHMPAERWALVLNPSLPGLLDDLAEGMDALDPPLRADLPAVRRSLLATAADLRRSAGAARKLAELVRPALRRLVSPPPLPADPSAASAWLSGFDRARAIRRPDLVRHYAIAGAPGGLDADGLRALADARWGAATKSHGYWTYHPARAL